MKTVVVTGGTRGIGLEIVTRLVGEGYRVVAVGRRPSAGLDALLAAHADVLSFAAYDFDDLAGIHDFATRLAREHPGLYGLVNNAALGHAGLLPTLHERDIGALLRVNVEAPILLTKYLLRPMLIRGEGRIINISSVVAETGYKGLAVYGATKAALTGFTRSLAREVGKAGITVNAVAPGYLATDMTSGLADGQLDSIRRRSALGRLPEGSDVAAAVAYLLGEGARNVTGTTLTVDAGSTA